MTDDSLKHKEDLAIKLLKEIPSDDIELCYSGGKDSDVILHLARLAGIPFTAIYKNTTIDPPGTIKHCQENGVQIVQPKNTFFELIDHKGFPTRRARFCCSELKEYKIKDHAVLGIRREESKARQKRYAEPQICRVYSKDSKCKQYFPILFWNKEDIKEYIEQNGIKLHPLYYNDDGIIDIERRLGCMCCPLAADCGRSEFQHYPKMLKLWLKHGLIWWEKHPNTSSHKKFTSIYALMAHNLFFDDYNTFVTYDRYGMFGMEDWKARLEDYFGIDL